MGKTWLNTSRVTKQRTTTGQAPLHKQWVCISRVVWLGKSSKGSKTNAHLSHQAMQVTLSTKAQQFQEWLIGHACGQETSRICSYRRLCRPQVASNRTEETTSRILLHLCSHQAAKWKWSVDMSSTPTKWTLTWVKSLSQPHVHKEIP